MTSSEAAPTARSRVPFVTVPLRPRFFQASAYFPMPIVLLATRGPDGATNLAPYSLCFPHVRDEGHFMVLVTRSASKTATNLARSGRVSINFIPDKAEYLDNARLLSAALPTADKMAQSVFSCLPSELAPGRDGSAAPPLVAEAIQVFECKLVEASANADEQRFLLEVEAIRMQPYWARVLESGRPGPRLPVDYGFRRATASWMTRPRVVASGPRLRPRFTLAVERAPEAVLEDFREALARSDAEVIGKVRGAVIQLAMPRAQTTTWSPTIDLSVEAAPHGATIYGRIGPQPQVWTTFMFFHLVIAMLGIGGLMWGLGQALSGGSAWPVWIAVAALPLHAFVAGAAFIGQGLGAEQTHRLRSFVDDVLGA